MSGKTIRINRFYQLKLKELTLLLEQAKELIPNHNPSVGYVGEEVLRNFLRQTLPARFKVTQGFIAYESKISPQCDIIIYDANEGSPLYSFGNIDIVPASAVKATIEVKVSISPTRFHEVLTSFEELAKMRITNNYLFVFSAPGPRSFENYIFHREAPAVKRFFQDYEGTGCCIAASSTCYDASDYEMLPKTIVVLDKDYCLEKDHVQDAKNDYYGYVAAELTDRSNLKMACLQIFATTLLDSILPRRDDECYPEPLTSPEESDDDVVDIKYTYQIPVCAM